MNLSTETVEVIAGGMEHHHQRQWHYYLNVFSIVWIFFLAKNLKNWGREKTNQIGLVLKDPEKK